MNLEFGKMSRCSLAGLAVALAAAAIGCGGGGGGGGGSSPTAPPAPPVTPVGAYTVGGQLLLQNISYTDPNGQQTILEAEIQFDGETLAPCERTSSSPGTGGMVFCGNIYRKIGVSAGSHTLSCRLTRQTDGARHLYHCMGAYAVFDASGTEVQSRQINPVRGQIRAGERIEIPVSVP